MDGDINGSHPRTQSDFYQELYQKYPHAFRRRLEAREAGRRLFNNKPQVRFKDELEVLDDSYGNSWNTDRSAPELHQTNWDKEVGHYFRHKSCSRDCITSLEPSECSGSVLSVSQRLRLNSQNLNKLLYESSPLKKYQQRELVQYDSGTENEQSLQEYMLEKSKERSRNRKKQRIIIQRKLSKSENGESNKENDLRSRRWMSKSASPTAQHRLRYSLLAEPQPKRDHGIDDLIADSDLKIDTVLEKISLKMVSPDSPPDSAIDVETPSVQSLVTMETQKNKKFNKPLLVQEELPNITSGANNDGVDGIESSPGSTASACMRKNTENQMETERHESLTCNDLNDDVQPIELATADADILVGQAVTTNAKSTQQINDKPPGIVNQGTCLEIRENVSVSPGLLQVCTADMGYNKDNEEHCDLKNVVSDSKDLDNCVQSGVNSDQDSDSKNQDAVHLNVKPCCLDNLDNKAELERDVIQKEVLTETQQVHSETNDIQEKVIDNADDEEEINIDKTITMDIKVVNGSKQHPKSRDSDVDSGIGQSSNCTDAVPLLQQGSRGTTLKQLPVKADHDILPLRSEVDVDILHEVDMLNSPQDEEISDTDDTNWRFGKFRISGREKKVAEKFQKAHTPLPYMLTPWQQSPRWRPKSAPMFFRSNLDLRVVDIPLSNESIELAKERSSQKFSAQEPVTRQVINGDVNHFHNGAIPKTKKVTAAPKYKNTDLSTKYASTPDLYTHDIHTQALHKHNQQDHLSSSGFKHRKHSITSESSRTSSLSLLSDSDTENSQIHNRNQKEEFIFKDTVKNSCSLKDTQSHSRSKVLTSEKDEVHSGEIQNIDYMVCDNLPDNKSSFGTKRGSFQPTVSSPRVKEKRLKLKNILKDKKGSFVPSEGVSPNVGERNEARNRIYAKNRGSHSGSVGRGSNCGDKRVSVSSYSSGDSGLVNDTNKMVSSDRIRRDPHTHVCEGVESGWQVEKLSKAAEYDKDTNSKNKTEVALCARDTESIDTLTGPDIQTLTAQPVILDRDNKNSDNRRTLPQTSDSDPGSLDSSGSPQKAQPPKKPARKKHKDKNLPPDLNLSKYKITAASNPELNCRTSPQSFSSADAHSQSDIRYPSHDQNKPVDVRKESTSSNDAQAFHEPDQRLSAASHVPQVQHGQPSDEIEVMEIQRGDLARSKEISASKSSIFNKTKGKFKLFKKALSMEKGMDSCGVQDQNGHLQGDHSHMPKVKKAPSLKSITSLFKRKKKKGKMHIHDTDPSYHGSTHYIAAENPSLLNANKRKQWSSCHALTADTHSSNQPMRKQNFSNQPIGKLQMVNPDGTQMIQLTKPEDEPIGFFIAKGNAKYGSGIFVSRFSATRPDSSFAGLLSIGDEIIEVNGHLVRDLSQDAVCSLISASPVIVMKVLPLIARKDV